MQEGLESYSMEEDEECETPQEHRRRMNRLSAQRSRKRKRQRVLELESQVAKLKAENQELKALVKELQQQQPNSVEDLVVFSGMCENIKDTLGLF